MAKAQKSPFSWLMRKLGIGGKKSTTTEFQASGPSIEEINNMPVVSPSDSSTSYNNPHSFELSSGNPYQPPPFSNARNARDAARFDDLEASSDVPNAGDNPTKSDFESPGGPEGWGAAADAAAAYHALVNNGEFTPKPVDGRAAATFPGSTEYASLSDRGARHPKPQTTYAALNSPSQAAITPAAAAATTAAAPGEQKQGLQRQNAKRNFQRPSKP